MLDPRDLQPLGRRGANQLVNGLSCGMRWARASMLLATTAALAIGCGPSIEPCTPAQCLAIAERHIQIGWTQQWDVTRVYLKRACDGGIAVACQKLGAYGVTIAEKRPGEHDPEVLALDRGCALGDGESCNHAAYFHSDRLRLHDRACDLGYRGGCENAAILRAKSPDIAERRRAVPVLEVGCREKHEWMCTRLVEVFEEPPLKDEASARRAHALHCEAGKRETCMRLGFEAAVGLRTAKDPAEAKRLVLLGCESKVDCKAEKQLARWFAQGDERPILVRVLEAKREHFVVELPPGVHLRKGTEVAELGWSLKINDVAGFEGTVIQEREGQSVMSQKAMGLGGPNSSFSAQLYITPAWGSLVLLTVKDATRQVGANAP